MRGGLKLLSCVWLVAFAAFAQAQSIRQYQLETSEGGFALVMHTVPRPTAGPDEVLVRVRATSLNRRDLLMLNGQYAASGDMSVRIPLSDGAGEVIEVGDNVTRFAPGDRVAGIFFEQWIDGDRTGQTLGSARGGNAGGMLSEIIVSHADSLVAIPDHLSYEEAATLPCAGVTAWVGLFEHDRLEPEEFVLLEGTGGVSTFGLLIAAAAGARPIITSSSNEKLEMARKLGAFGTANYRENEEWQDAVRSITGDVGVHHVLEVGGSDTLPKALQALAYDGHIAIIGGLSGFAPQVSVGQLMGLGASVTGIYVGSRSHFEAFNDFLAEHEIHPVVDRVFAFEEAPQAFEFMENGSYFGKIVIAL